MNMDDFGRRCLAWPATYIGAGLTILGGWCLRFALWLLDEEWDEEDW